MKYITLPISRKGVFPSAKPRKNTLKIPVSSEDKHTLLSHLINKRRRKQFFKSNEESKQFRESYIKQYQELLKQ